MSNPYFKFKQFTVYHDQCAMKVGTDGVLLGAWCNITGSRNILDIGTGTGLIALMIAQRSKAKIDAIDVDESAYNQATENVKKSSFKKHITVIHCDLATFANSNSKQYDLIVSNPPYFLNSLKCPNNQRNIARHAETLTIHVLCNSVEKLLTPTGIFAIILPYEQKEVLLKTAEKNNLHLLRETDIYPTPEAEPKRILAEFSRTITKNPNLTRLIIEITRHHYTNEYKALTKDFYLKM